MSLEYILFEKPWIQYNDTFLRSRLVLQYPKNVIFVIQLVDNILQSDTYKKYPYAEKIDVKSLKETNWKNSIISFNYNLQLIFAPPSVQRLISLYRRLHPADIFNPFRWSFLELFQYQWLGIIFFILIYTVWLSISKLYKHKRTLILLPNKVSNAVKLTSR